MTTPECQNALLLSLTRKDRTLMLSQMDEVALAARDPIENANTPIKYIYFPDSGIISVLARSLDDQIEAGVIGREGMSGTAVVLGNHRSPNDAHVQIPGRGRRISAPDLRTAMESSAALRRKLQLYAQVFMVQIAQTAFANGKAQIDERLARWLLMAHDRQDEDDLYLTHEFIAASLGVRRSGVTDALHALEGAGLVRAGRGVVTITNRKGLVALAGSIYGVPEAEYRRLIG